VVLSPSRVCPPCQNTSQKVPIPSLSNSAKVRTKPFTHGPLGDIADPNNSLCLSEGQSLLTWYPRLYCYHAMNTMLSSLYFPQADCFVYYFASWPWLGFLDLCTQSSKGHLKAISFKPQSLVKTWQAVPSCRRNSANFSKAPISTGLWFQSHN
jgi:hypothetical protein